VTNLFETKLPPSFDTIDTSDSFNEASNGLAQNLANNHLSKFRDAIKDEIADRQMSREELTGSAAMAMVGAFTKAAETKREYAQSLGELSKYYLVDALMNLIADETLITDIMTGEIVQLQGVNKKIDDELKILQRRLNIDQIVEDITLDLLKYGDYTLSMDMESGEGVTSVTDNVRQENIVALYRHGLPEKFLIREKAKIRILPASTHLHFALGRSKLRIELGSEFDVANDDLENLRNKLPNYVRVGRPLLYGVQSKLKELQLLEALVPASKLHQLSTGSLVGVSVPNQTDPKEAFAISRRYESLLNSKTALDKRSGTLADVGDILATAGRTKVVPVMGDKGNLQSIDVKENRAADDMLSSIRDIRSTICSTIGVPPELLFGSDSAESKGEFLKRHARYLRKIKSIQTALANGLKQLALAHLISMGHEVMPNDIQIVFRNEVVNIDELDKLEFADQVNTMVSDLWAFMTELNDSEYFQGRIDFEALSEWMRRQMALMGSNRSFIKPLDESLNENQYHDPTPPKKNFKPKVVRRSEQADADEKPDEPRQDAILQEAMKMLAAKMQELSVDVARRPSEDADAGDEIKPSAKATNEASPAKESTKTSASEPVPEPLTVVDESDLEIAGSKPVAVKPEAKPKAKRKFRTANMRAKTNPTPRTTKPSTTAKANIKAKRETNSKDKT
jgi:hypothetical protein